jgi:hypothetical protein
MSGRWAMATNTEDNAPSELVVSGAMGWHRDCTPDTHRGGD